LLGQVPKLGKEAFLELQSYHHVEDRQAVYFLVLYCKEIRKPLYLEAFALLIVSLSLIK
jgi:hypothetical protein